MAHLKLNSGKKSFYEPWDMIPFFKLIFSQFVNCCSARVWLPKQFLSGECSNKTNGKFQTELNGITLNSNRCNQLFRLGTISNNLEFFALLESSKGDLVPILQTGIVNTPQEYKTGLTSWYQTLFFFLARHHSHQMSEVAKATLCVQILKWQSVS